MDILQNEILDMPTGKKMDMLIAEKVMGWHLIPDENDKDGIHWRQMWLDANNRFMHNDFQPSNNLSDAWEVIEKMEENDVSFSMADIIPNSDPIAYEFKFMKGLSDYYACEFTVPLAICRAALLSVLEVKGG